MLTINQNIENYGKAVGNLELSPFESVDMLHRRSYLESKMNELSNEEKIRLYSYDLKLITNAKQMSEHIKLVYDFSKSDEPLTEWWWHLDKVANKEISFNLSPNFMAI